MEVMRNACYNNFAKVCVNYGQRVQNSVFECVMDQAKCREVKHKLTGLIDKEHDSLRFYYLGNNYENKVEQIGVMPSFKGVECIVYMNYFARTVSSHETLGRFAP